MSRELRQVGKAEVEPLTSEYSNGVTTWMYGVTPTVSMSLKNVIMSAQPTLPLQRGTEVV